MAATAPRAAIAARRRTLPTRALAAASTAASAAACRAARFCSLACLISAFLPWELSLAATASGDLHQARNILVRCAHMLKPAHKVTLAKRITSLDVRRRACFSAH